MPVEVKVKPIMKKLTFLLRHCASPQTRHLTLQWSPLSLRPPSSHLHCLFTVCLGVRDTPSLWATRTPSLVHSHLSQLSAQRQLGWEDTAWKQTSQNDSDFTCRGYKYCSLASQSGPLFPFLFHISEYNQELWCYCAASSFSLLDKVTTRHTAKNFVFTVYGNASEALQLF